MASVIQVIGTPQGSQVETFPIPLKVKFGGTGSLIKAGMLVVIDGSNPGYVTVAADAATNTALIFGVAATDSTETAAVDGTVTLYVAPFLLIKIKAAIPANLTATMVGLKYILEMSAGVNKLDQATTTNGIFTLIDFDNTTDGNCTAVVACNKFQA